LTDSAVSLRHPG